MKFIKITTLFVLLIFSWESCFASFRKNVKAQYKNNSGWSDQFSVEAIFMKGPELNKATNSYKYTSYSLFAVIFWNQEGNASVIELDGYDSCGLEADRDCIEYHIGDWEGKDQQGREWTICSGHFCTAKSNSYSYVPNYSINNGNSTKSYNSNSKTRHWINAGLVIMLIGFIVLDVGLLLYIMDEEQETPGLITMAVGGGLMVLGPLFMLGDISSSSHHSENNLYEKRKIFSGSKTLGLSLRFEF